MNYSEIMEQLKAKNTKIEQEIKQITQEKEEKLEEATKNITVEYDTLLKEKAKTSKALTGQINEINALLYYYSFFDNERLGLIISALISIFESEEYLYKVKQIKVTQTIFDSWGSNYETINEDVALVYKKDFDISLIKSEKDLNKYDLVVLGQRYYIDDLRFYNPKGQSLLANLNPKYAYVKDFIDYLISKKIEAKTENMSFEEMKAWLKKYLLWHQEEIEVNHQKRIASQIVQRKEAQKSYSLNKILSNL